MLSFYLATPTIGSSHPSTGRIFYLLRLVIKLLLPVRGNYLKTEEMNLRAPCASKPTGPLQLPLIVYCRCNHCTVHQILFGRDFWTLFFLGIYVKMWHWPYQVPQNIGDVEGRPSTTYHEYCPFWNNVTFLRRQKSHNHHFREMQNSLGKHTMSKFFEKTSFSSGK